jgi:LEA14-like dessication related protein
MKKSIIVAIILCVLFIFTTCQTLMSAFQEPVISLHSVELTSININSAQLLCKVQVQNPNSFEIPFPKTDWEIFISGNSFLSGAIMNNHKIKARNTVLIDVPVKLEYLDIINTFISLKGSKQVIYKIALAVNFSFPVFGEKVWNFDFQGEIPIPQLPVLSTPVLIIDSIDLIKVELLVTMNIENPNMFELPSPKFSYDYQLNRNSFIKGNIENEAPLAPSSVTPLNFRMVVNYADFFRTFTSLLTAREVASLLIINCDFGIPFFGGESKRFEVSGSLPIRR